MRDKKLEELSPLADKVEALERELEETRSNLSRMQRDLLDSQRREAEAKRDLEAATSKGGSSDPTVSV